MTANVVSIDFRRGSTSESNPNALDFDEVVGTLVLENKDGLYDPISNLTQSGRGIDAAALSQI